MNAEEHSQRLEKQLLDYHTQRASLWIRRAALVGIGISLSIGLFEFITRYRSHQAHTAYREATQTYEKLRAEIGSQLRLAKQATWSTLLTSSLQNPLLTIFLTTLSESLSDTTLVTHLSFTAPSTITIKGYSDLMSDLIRLTESLSTKWHTKVHLLRSSHDVAGICFELSTTLPSEAKKRTTLAKA